MGSLKWEAHSPDWPGQKQNLISKIARVKLDGDVGLSSTSTCLTSMMPCTGPQNHQQKPLDLEGPSSEIGALGKSGSAMCGHTAWEPC
jgi:hypothetical protein